MSNYIKRDGGGHTEKDHDIAGIVLMIISAFFLLCFAVPVIFGPVSRAIQSFFLGSFGIFSYALFAFVFALGLGLLLRRRISVSVKKALMIAGIALFLMLLLQLITTHAHLSSGIGGYLSAVYEAKWTAGGVVFGVIAYGIRALISIVGAYIVISLLLVGCAALLVYTIVRERGLPAVRRAKPKLPVRREEREEGLPEETETLSERVRRNGGTSSLFVEDVVAENSREEEDESAGGLYDEDFGRYGGERRRLSQSQAANILYQPLGTGSERDLDPILGYMRKTENEKAEEPRRGAPGNGYYENARESEAARMTETAPDVGPASVETHKKPDKIFHENTRSGNGFSDLTLPTPKTPEADNNDGHIISSNSFGSGFDRSAFTTFADDRTSERGGYSNGGELRGENRAERESASASGSFYDRADAGIVSADDYASEEPAPSDEGQREEPQPQEKRRSGYAGYGGLDNVTFGKTGRNIADNDSPIASEGWLEQASAEAGDDAAAMPEPEPKPFYAEETPDDRADDRTDKLYDSFSAAPSTPIVTETDYERKSGETVYEEPITEETPVVAEAHEEETPVEEDRLVIDDAEVTDLSERSDFSEEDHTGYYVRGGSAAPFREERAKEPEPEPVAPVQPVEEKYEPYIYEKPPLDLLGLPDNTNVVDTADLQEKTRAIEETLNDLKFPAKVCNVIVGPAVTRFELQPPKGISVNRIMNFGSDLELRLASGAVRIEAPVANKPVIGIEVANRISVAVAFREIIDSPKFRDSHGALPLALGKDIGGDAIVCNLEKMPHLLVAGATNMGKSVCLNTIIVSLIYRSSPEDVRIVLVDPKQIEFTLYRGLPHLLLKNPITDVNHAVNMLNYLIDEMERRFTLFNEMASKGYAVRNLEEYNKSEPVRSGKQRKLPYIVMIVDELADLMTTRKKDVENGIRRLTQKARAAGIHLVLATQRPSVDIITGSIKVNLPARISLKVTSQVDSRTILDQAGAEALLGKGDMLLSLTGEPVRLQGALITNDEIVSIVNYVKDNNKAIFDESIENAVLVEHTEQEETEAPTEMEESADEKLLPAIMECFIRGRKASTSMIQTRFALGYARAARIINTIEMRKWIGPSVGAKPREVYMTESQYESVFGIPFGE